MAIPEGKKRVAFTLSDNVLEKLVVLYELDKENTAGRIYESDTLSKIIKAAYDEKNVTDYKKTI